jgi:flagellar biosynthesis protein FlhB
VRFALEDLGAAFLRLLLAASAALAVLAGADTAWVRWQHTRRLRVSREDCGRKRAKARATRT